MGTRKWHVARAQHNLKAAEFLHENGEFADWAITALYYSALHWVDSVLADDAGLPKDERNPRAHTGTKKGRRGRNQLVAARCPTIRRDYRDLEDFSRRTRYDIDMLSFDMPVFDRARAMLERIEKFAKAMHASREIIPSDAP